MGSEAPQRFEGAELLGTGGMASVYRALDSQTGHQVALKRLRSDLKDSLREDLRELFHREYRILSELSHPRIIEVYDYGIDDEGPFYTMELLDGTDLRSKLPVPWREACAIARDVCSSLALLHSRGYVHRDVSPANVWVTSSEEAKLLDFGAMTPMGICRMLVGNPACVAPEAILQQPLDGRSDLFSLGATLYWALTARRPYPAKKFSDLEALHRKLPPRPAELVDDIPPAVDRVVLSLMSIDPAARPRSAAEAIERLTAAADLPELESEAVPRAYLAVPALVGREELTEGFRERVRRLMSGRGGAVRLAGAAGMGRSRALDACVMEAKLAGATVLRASSRDAAQGPYGALRALVADLSPELAEELRASDADGTGLAALVDGGTIPDDPTSRPAFHRALLQYVHEAARKHRPLVFAVDDLADCDEPSQAALLALANESRRRPAMVLCTDTDHEQRFGDTSPISTLREIARSLDVLPLSQQQLEQLLRSVFGDAPNVSTVASYIGQRAQGSPRVCMELAQALLDHGLARYEKGSWQLPASLDDVALPATLADARRERLPERGTDAREAAEILALGKGHVADPAKLAAACGHKDRARVDAAVDMLVRTGIVRTQSGRVHLADGLWADVLHEELPTNRKQEISGRLARLLQRDGADPLWRADFWLDAADDEAAVALLADELSSHSRLDDAPFDHAALLQRAVQACTRLHSSPARRFPLLRELARLSLNVTISGMPEVFHELLGYLTHDSGLDDWHALEEVTDSSARLHQALETAQARYEAGGAYVLAPADALRELAWTVYEAAAHSTMMANSALLWSLPSLEPLSALSPGIRAVQNAVRATRAVLGARFEDAIEIYEGRLRELESPDRGGLDEAQAQRSWYLVVHVLGTLYGNMARDEAIKYADLLDQDEAGAIHAAFVRYMYYQRVGMLVEAERWSRRAELLQVQQKRPHALTFAVLRARVEYSFLADDLPTAVQCVKELESVVDRFPSFRPYLHFARAVRERTRGNHEAALEETRAALELAEPGKDIVWPWAAISEVECLRLLGRLQEAKSHGLAHDAEMERVGIRVLRRSNYPLGLVEAQLGEYENAMQRMNTSVSHIKRLNMRGLNVGRAYEFRALVALWSGDLEQFHEDAERCAESYKEGRNNPALAGRYERLMQEARSREVSVGEQLERAAVGDTGHGSRLTEYAQQTVAQLFTSSETREDRVRAALRLLCEAAGASAGWLYLIHEDGWRLEMGEDEEPADVHSLAARLLTVEHEPDAELDDADQTEAAPAEEQQAASSGTTSSSDGATSVDTSGMTRRGMILSYTSKQKVEVVGAAVFRSSGHFKPEIYAMATTVSRMLAEAGDVTPRTLG